MTELITPPTFILGAPRSGTTLLYKALCLHPDAGWISNYVRRAPRRPELAVLNRLARRSLDRRRTVWFGAESSNAYVYGSRRRLVERVFPMPVEGEPLFRACGFLGEQGDGGKADAADCLRRAVARLLQWSGTRHFVNKRIANNQRVPQLAQAFPDARYLLITRDGRAVAASLAKVDWWPTSKPFWHGDTPDAWAGAGGDPWELCAREWVEQLESMEAGLHAVPSDQIARIKFEELVEAPLTTLKQMADFMGLPASPEWEGELGHLRFPPKGDRWRSELDGRAVKTVESFQMPLLRAHGYA